MPKNIQNIIKVKFKRTFFDNLQYTWLFEDAPTEVKLHLKQFLGADADIIICCYFSANNWFAITSDVLISEKNKTRQTILFKDVLKVDCDLKKLAADKRLPYDTIELCTSNNNVLLEVEKRTWGSWLEVLRILNLRAI